MELSCTRLTPALGAVATLPSEPGDVSDELHDALTPGLRRDLEQLEAVHDMGAFRTGAYLDGGDEGIAEAFARAGTAVHPVIAHHPVTGRPYLNISEAFTRFVIGLSAPESARLLTHLFDLTNRPDFHVRIKWEVGTVVIWDNRGTQHYAVSDYLPHRRVMHRVAVATDKRTLMPDASDDTHVVRAGSEHRVEERPRLGVLR